MEALLTMLNFYIKILENVCLLECFLKGRQKQFDRIAFPKGVSVSFLKVNVYDITCNEILIKLCMLKCCIYLWIASFMYICCIFQVDKALKPGLVAHTWTSLSLPNYFTEVKNALNELQIIVKQVL